MHIYPAQLPEQVDFNTIRRRLSEGCSSAKARKLSLDLMPSASFDAVQTALTETNEFLMALHKGDSILLASFPDIEKDLQLLGIENAVLSVQQMVNVRTVVRHANAVLVFFGDKEDVYPALKVKTDAIEPDQFIVPAIDHIINKDGVVRDDASLELSTIRTALAANRRTSDRLYRTHIQRLKKEGQLADIEESFVNGRRVLGVLAEHKREVKGTILSQSSTGSITFIEPQNLIDLNNERLMMEEEEQREIYRILKELTATIRPFSYLINQYMEMLVEFDFIHAKAILARDLKATMPQLSSEGNQLHLINAYHPVLFMQNNSKHEPTYPISCTFSETERIMVISGPNAGGKSITLKTIGLLQLMVQCGLLIPASAKSEFSIKSAMFADIGDSQSIEDGLSTYSSRLIKMKYFLEHTNSRTLFLIDEFGTGSDPDMGGALAEVVLDTLNDARAQGVVTTHFTNLKILANNKEGIFNACMLFNNRTLKPLYQLQIGEPGSSFTFEVAEKIGLPQHFIEKAKATLSNDKVDMDKLLNALQAEKNTIARLRKDLQKQMSKATAEKRSFQELSGKMTETFFAEQKDRQEKLRLVELGKKLEQLTKEWQSAKDKKEVIGKFVKLAGFEQHRKREQDALQQTAAYQQARLEKIRQKVTTGSKVRLMNSREVGVIKEITANRANVLFGNVIMNVGLEKLEPVQLSK